MKKKLFLGLLFLLSFSSLQKTQALDTGNYYSTRLKEGQILIWESSSEEILPEPITYDTDKIKVFLLLIMK